MPQQRKTANQSTKGTPAAPTASKATAKVEETINYYSKPSWVFESMTIKPTVLKLPNNNLRAENPKTGRHEAIRYCENEDSIWVKDQGATVKKGFIYFEDGTLEVSSDETTKLDFLFHHPEYGNTFRLLDRERDAKVSLADQQLSFEAQSMAFKADIKELQVIARAKGLDYESEVLCRNAMAEYARQQPKEFLEAFDSELIKIISMLKQAENEGIISFNGSQLRWTDTNKALITVPSGRQHIEYAAQILVEPSEKNKAALEELARVLS